MAHLFENREQIDTYNKQIGNICCVYKKNKLIELAYIKLTIGKENITQTIIIIVRTSNINSLHVILI